MQPEGSLSEVEAIRRKIMRQVASTSLSDLSGCKGRPLSEVEGTRRKIEVKFLTLPLTENAGCFAPHLSMKGA